LGEADWVVLTHMRKATLGFSAGMIIWGCVSFLLSVAGLYRIDLEAMAPVPVSVLYAVYLGEAIPVLLGGSVAGYVSGKPGMISGAVFGICQGVILFAIWLGESSPEMWPFRENFALMYAGPGVLGAYLGLKVARIRRRRSNPPDHEVTDSPSP
jgi:hypothetical protein